MARASLRSRPKTQIKTAPKIELRPKPAIREYKIHVVKASPSVFADVLSGEKTWELRVNDRDYQSGDEVIMQEWDRSSIAGYTGRECRGQIREIAFDFEIGAFGAEMTMKPEYGFAFFRFKLNG